MDRDDGPWKDWMDRNVGPFKDRKDRGLGGPRGQGRLDRVDRSNQAQSYPEGSGFKLERLTGFEGFQSIQARENKLPGDSMPLPGFTSSTPTRTWNGFLSMTEITRTKLPM